MSTWPHGGARKSSSPSGRTRANTVDAIALRSGRAVRQLLNDARQRLLSVERHEIFRRPLDRINQLRQLLDDRQRALGFAVSGRLQAAKPEPAGADVVARFRRSSSAASTVASCAAASRATGSDEQFGVAPARTATVSGDGDGCAATRTVTRSGAEARVFDDDDQEIGEARSRLRRRCIRGDRLVTRFADGTVESVAEDQKQLPLFD